MLVFDTMMFWVLAVVPVCDKGTSGASGKASSAQSGVCFAALPCSVAAGFQTALTEVQGQSGICSRTRRVPGSARITSHPQCLPDFLVFTLSYEKTRSSHRTDRV